MSRRSLIAALVATLAVALLLVGCGSSGSSSSSSTTASSTAPAASSTSAPTTTAPAQTGFEGAAIESGSDVGSPGTTQTGKVDGIQCGASEQLAYHIHAHLLVNVDGSSRALPGGIGIPGSQIVQTSEGPVANGGQCIYWLHTHAPDGVIHIESPTKRIYTLGNFFDEWHQPLSSSAVADAKGTVSAIVDGKSWTKDPRSIPLNPHAVIQLNVGSPVIPFQSFSWIGTQL